MERLKKVLLSEGVRDNGFLVGRLFGVLIRGPCLSWNNIFDTQEKRKENITTSISRCDATCVMHPKKSACHRSSETFSFFFLFAFGICLVSMTFLECELTQCASYDGERGGARGDSCNKFNAIEFLFLSHDIHQVLTRGELSPSEKASSPPSLNDKEENIKSHPMISYPSFSTKDDRN